MKALISIFIIVIVCLGAYKLWEYYDRVGREREATEAARNVSDESLAGLPSQLEPSLKKAKAEGPKALKQWLDTYKRSPLVKDPRLAAIELDYVLLVKDPVEARRVFAEVKKRTLPDSPLYPRIQALAKTYE